MGGLQNVRTYAASREGLPDISDSNAAYCVLLGLFLATSVSLLLDVLIDVDSFAYW